MNNLQKHEGILIACYFTDWSIEAEKPGIIYCCHSVEESNECHETIMQGDNHPLLVKEIKRARPEDICCWCNSLYELDERR